MKRKKERDRVIKTTKKPVGHTVLLMSLANHMCYMPRMWSEGWIGVHVYVCMCKKIKRVLVCGCRLCVCSCLTLCVMCWCVCVCVCVDTYIESLCGGVVYVCVSA